MDSRRPLPLAIFIALLRSAPLLVWGGGLLWWGLQVAPFEELGPRTIDVYSFHIVGALMIGAAMIGFAINVMRSRKPVKRKEGSVQAEDKPFDPDAALQNYLASRQQPDAPAEVSQPARPVFGKRVS